MKMSDQSAAPEAPMRIRIAVAIRDHDFADTLVVLLRHAGYLVVEQEVADYVVMQVGGHSIAIVMTSSRPDNGDMDVLLPSQASASTVLAAMLQIALPDREITRQPTHRGH